MADAQARNPESAVGFGPEVEDHQGRSVLDADRRIIAADLDPDDVFRRAYCNLGGTTNQSQVASELLHALFNRLRRGHEVIEQWIRSERRASLELETEVR